MSLDFVGMGGGMLLGPSLYTCTLCNIDNQVDIGVVVVVRPSGDLDIAIGHTDVLRIDLQIFRSRHNGELDGALCAKRLVAPLSDRTDLLYSGNTVVRDENLKSSITVSTLTH